MKIDNERLDLPSASAFEILAECTGQPQLLRMLPPEARSMADEDRDPLAERGTRIHRARETENLLPLSTEELELYNAGLAYEQKLIAKWKETFALTEVEEKPRELRLWMHDANCNPVCSGQLDVHYVSGKFALIVDWKTGFCSNLVGARGNWQLRLQAVLAKLEYEQVTEIRVAFAKPMFQHSELDFCDYVEADLKYSHDAILYQLWWSTQPDAPRRAGLHCNWCPCKAWCPEGLAYALLPSTIAKVFNPKHIPERVNTVTGDDLYRIWEAGPVIRKIIDAVTARLKTMQPDELFLMGLERGKARENSEITNVKEAFEFLKDKQGWAEEWIWNALSFINGHLAKVAGRLHGLDEDEAKDWVKKTLAEFITVTPSDRPIKKRK